MGFGGDLYSDGSCEHSPIRGLARAACASAEVDAEGKRRRAIYLPVPRHLPQTSQAGEHIGVAVSRRMAARTAHVRSDCANVVRAANAPIKLALSPAKVYSCIVLDRYTRLGEAAVAGTTVSWVKAHRADCDAHDADTRRDVRGNAVADQLAGQAVALHPQPSIDQKRMLDFYLRRAPLFARAIGVTLAMFPPSEEQRLARKPKPEDERAAAARDQHFWVFSQCMWRCERCGKWAHGDTLSARHVAEHCSGHIAHLRAAEWSDKGHNISRVSGDLPIAFCGRCGAWGYRRTHNLGRPCRGPTPAGAQALARIAKGQHPWRKRLPGGGSAPRSNILVTTAFDKCSKMWRSRRAGSEARSRVAGGTAEDGTSDRIGDGINTATASDTADMEDEVRGQTPHLPEHGAADSCDEDPFGHGGNLSQEESPAASGAARNGAGDCSGAAASPLTNREGALGGEDDTTRTSNRSVANNGSLANSATGHAAGLTDRKRNLVSAGDRLEAMRRRVRARFSSAPTAPTAEAAKGKDGGMEDGRFDGGVSGQAVASQSEAMSTIDGSSTPQGRRCGSSSPGGARGQLHHLSELAAGHG